MPPAEKKLWYFLRAKRLNDYKFRRQAVIGDRYIADFLCAKIKLIIEVDGSQHADQQLYDNDRTVWLESRGYTVKRYWNNEILFAIHEVMDDIITTCNSLKLSPPS